jgi:hypothetical protein
VAEAVMRGGRSFVGLVVILVALGAYLYFVESKREPGSESRLEKVFAVQADAIEEITVRSDSGEQTTLRKSDGNWTIVAPVATEPDSVEVSGLTSGLSNLELQRVIDDNATNLEEYGLAPPAIEVAFRAGGEERRLQIGNKTPPGTDLYAKLADQPRVFLISSYLSSTFNKNTFDLRDKSVMKVERDKIDAIAVATPKRSLRFVKNDGEWRMMEPAAGRADFTAVDGLVSRIHTLQMRSIAAAEADGLAQYGLDKPAATVQLGTGSSQATLLLGKSTEDGTVYAKDQARAAVVTVDSSLLDELTKEPGEYRQKDLFDARSFNATRIEVAHTGQTLAFEKTTVKNKDGQDEEKWRQVAPSAQDVDQTKVEALLSSATLARATGFADSSAKTGLASPDVIITIRAGEGKPEETVRFARSGDEVHASRAGEPGVARVDVSALEAILKALEDLKAPPAASGQQ